MQNILFLCTGNYYRSRYAEIVFNSLASESRIAWRADSRALRISGANPGPISKHTIERLAQLGIALPAERYPQPVTEADFSRAHRIIAVKEAEHRPLMDETFPHWTSRVEFWHIDDLDCALPDQALSLLHEKLVALHDELCQSRREVA